MEKDTEIQGEKNEIKHEHLALRYSFFLLNEGFIQSVQMVVTNIRAELDSFQILSYKVHTVLVFLSFENEL